MLEKYIYLTEGVIVDLDSDIHKLHQALNDYTIMVQEFFQICVDEFLKTIGLEIFGIKTDFFKQKLQSTIFLFLFLKRSRRIVPQ